MEAQLKELIESLKNAEMELRSQGDKANARVESLNTEIAELRSQIDALTVASKRPAVGAGADVEMEQRKAVVIQHLRKGDMQVRTLTGATDEDGGVFLPADMIGKIVTRAANANELRAHASVGRTGRNRVFLPSLTRPLAGYGNVTPTEQDLTSDSNTLDVHSCKALVVIPEDSISDSEYDLESKLVEMLGDALGEAESKAMAVGALATEPQGVVCVATKANAITSLTSAVLGATDAEVVDLISKAKYKLKKAYRKNAKLICNSNTEGVLDKVRDAEGHKLMTRVGEKSYFDGIEVVTAEDMDDLGANKYPIVIGDLRHYEIYDRSNFAVKRLTGGVYDTSSTIGFLLKARHAAGVTQPEAFVPVKCKA